MSRFRDQIASGKNPEKEEGSAPSGPVDLLGDLLGGMEGLLGGPVAPAVPPIPKTGVLRADQPGQGQQTGLEIQARVLRRDAQTVILELTFANRSAAPLNG